MTKNFRIVVNAPIDRAFDAVDKEENIQNWMNGSLSTKYENLKDPENPVGTKFVHNFKGLMEIKGEVIAYKKPFLLGVGQNYKGINGTVFYHFSPITKHSTEINCTLEVPEGKEAKKILVKTLFPIFKLLVKKQLNSLKYLAERKIN